MVEDMDLLRPAEAAEALGLSLARLRRFAADGRLVTVRTLGGHRRYRQDDVLAVQRWMQRHENRDHDGGHGGVPRALRAVATGRSTGPAGRGGDAPDVPIPLSFTATAPTRASGSDAMRTLWAAG